MTTSINVRVPPMAVLVCLLGASPSQSDIISLDTSDWDHGSGPQTGWIDGQTVGTTDFGAAMLTITSNMVGTASPTANHMTRINESFFTGFAFQLVPSTTSPGATGFPDGYMRLDFEFSKPININSITFTDVDRQNGNWYDIIVAEGFVNGLGAIGTGLDANYSFASPTNQEIVNYQGLLAARPRSDTGNVQNTPPADVSFDFDVPVTAFSVYYFNNNTVDNGAATQTIGLRGNQFEVAVVPEPAPILLASLAATLLLIAGLRSSAAATPG